MGIRRGNEAGNSTENCKGTTPNYATSGNPGEASGAVVGLESVYTEMTL
jgi:hypothetical protein